jgi:hypothetical protein
MKYVRQTAKFGMYIKPSVLWDGTDRTIRFVIPGGSDSEYGTDPETRRIEPSATHGSPTIRQIHRPLVINFDKQGLHDFQPKRLNDTTGKQHFFDDLHRCKQIPLPSRTISRISASN